MTEVTAYIMYGMGGSMFDPANGELLLIRRLKEIGVKTAESPYQYSDTHKIIDVINKDRKDDMVIIGGDSLGANNTPYVAGYCHRQIDYIFGFQPSDYGAHIPVMSNVKEAHCIYDPHFVDTAGLGAYKWELATRNRKTKLMITEHRAMHPDDYGWAQDLIFYEIKRHLGT